MTQHPEPPLRAPRLALGLLCGLALLLRVLYATRSGIWRDEALVLALLPLEPHALWDFLRLHESHPPLFYFLLQAWQAVVGTSEQAALALSVVAGVALVPALYAVGARLYSPRTGLLAAAAVTASPLLAEHAALIRPYSLLPLVALGASYALVRGLTGGSRWRWGAYAGLTATLLWLHNWSVLLVAAQAAVAAGWLLWGAAAPRREAVLGWLGALTLAAVAYAPWLPALYHQATHAGHAPSQDPGAADSLALVAKCLSGVPQGGFALVGLLGLVALGAYGVYRGWGDGPQRPAALVFGLAPWLALAVSAAFASHTALLWPRTVVIVVPTLLLPAYAGLARLLPAGKRVTTMACVALVGFYGALALPMLALPKSNAREVAAVVAARQHPDDLIIIAPEWLAAAFNWYYKPANEQLDYPHPGRELAMWWDDLATRTADPAALERARARIALAQHAHRRVWLVVNETQLWSGAVPPTGLPPDLPPGNWMEVGALRSNQLLAALVASYGKPAKRVVTPLAAPGGEQLTAFLFEPAASP